MSIKNYFQGMFTMDKNDFFRQATLMICNNLKIEETLLATVHFLRDWMPVNYIFLEQYDESLDAMRTIAIASQQGGKSVDLLTSLSGEARKQAEDKYHIQRETVYLFTDPEQEQLAKEMLDYHRIQACSLMVMPLKAGAHTLGTLALASDCGDRFTQSHADLLSLLKEPFAIAMANALRHREVVQLKDMLYEDNRYLRREVRHFIGDEIIGANAGLRDVMERVEQVATLDIPVLLLGETGVGKDVIANAVHFLSFRREGPFIKVNCGAIPETLIDSELFGHEKGAFTGALSQKKGRFERAHTGTILLDEIGELPLQAQVRLLRVLQEKEIERVGGNETIHLDIRVIAATNRNLEEMVRRGQFREDLWFRLNVFPIVIPSLRERKGDIPALLNYFILEKSREYKLPAVPRIDPGQTDLLMEYDWPGNIRELQNLVERALILNPRGPLRFDCLNISGQRTESRMTFNTDMVETLDDVMVRYIRAVLSRTKGRIHGKGGAAELLGIHPSTLRSRMQKMGMRVKRTPLHLNHA